MGSPWVAHEYPMGSPWPTYGQPLTHGLPMDFSLTTRSLRTDNHSKLMGCPWATHGRSMGYPLQQLETHCDAWATHELLLD